jgi:nitrous oxidase accessory protein NosD
MGTRNVTIRNNVFRDCNFGVARGAGVIDIFAEVGPRLAGPGVHRGIAVEKNRIINADGAAIHVGSADGVTIRYNAIEKASGYGVLVRNSANVVVEKNKFTDVKQLVSFGEGADTMTIFVDTE